MKHFIKLKWYITDEKPTQSFCDIWQWRSNINASFFQPEVTSAVSAFRRPHLRAATYYCLPSSIDADSEESQPTAVAMRYGIPFASLARALSCCCCCWLTIAG